MRRADGNKHLAGALHHAGDPVRPARVAIGEQQLFEHRRRVELVVGGDLVGIARRPCLEQIARVGCLRRQLVEHNTEQRRLVGIGQPVEEAELLRRCLQPDQRLGGGLGAHRQSRLDAVRRRDAQPRDRDAAEGERCEPRLHPVERCDRQPQFGCGPHDRGAAGGDAVRERLQPRLPPDVAQQDRERHRIVGHDCLDDDGVGGVEARRNARGQPRDVGRQLVHRAEQRDLGIGVADHPHRRFCRRRGCQQQRDQQPLHHAGQYRSRSRRLYSLPVSWRGISRTKSTDFGHLIWLSRSRA